MPHRSRTTMTLIVAVVAVALAAAVAAVWSVAPYGEQGSGLDRRFDYSLDQMAPIDPLLIGYAQVETYRVSMRQPRAIAAARDGTMYVAGDRAVQVLDPRGRLRDKIALDGEPTCVAVSHDAAGATSAIYVGMDDRVEVFSPAGEPRATWPSAGEKAVFTSLAVGEGDVFVADAGNKVVWRYDAEGNVVGQIGRRDREAGIPGLVIPSPHFDVAWGPDGLLRAVNPGGHRIEVYTRDGHLEEPLVWGRAGTAVERFCGCCNPIAIALLDDRRVVTAEKGIPRVKVYSPEGQFETVVAGPTLLSPTPTAVEETRPEHQLRALDLAVDAEQRVLVLDPSARMIRVFAVKEPTGP